MSTDKAELFLFYWKILSDFPIPESEYNFDANIGRKHRFDFAFPEHLVAVEIEGNAWNVKGGGKHMQERDLEKYNIAATMGWRILRFSPAMLIKDPDACIKTVLEAIKWTKPTSSAVVVISASVDVGEGVTMHTTPLSIISKNVERPSTPNSTTSGILSSSITRNTSTENLTPAHGGKSSGRNKSKDTAKRQ